jgi:hypothetical protein
MPEAVASVVRFVTVFCTCPYPYDTFVEVWIYEETVLKMPLIEVFPPIDDPPITSAGVEDM